MIEHIGVVILILGVGFAINKFNQMRRRLEEIEEKVLSQTVELTSIDYNYLNDRSNELWGDISDGKKSDEMMFGRIRWLEEEFFKLKDQRSKK